MIDNKTVLGVLLGIIEKTKKELSAKFVGVEQIEVLRGKDGHDGLDGKDGKDGLNGLDGLDGKDGKDGKDGLDGKDGKNGLDGKDGAKGDKGDRGEKGDKGADGKDGTDGLNGKDGKDGRDGVNGKNGRDGVDGKDGKNGKNGTKGDKGEKGDRGAKGDKGEKGEKGDRGDKGADGKDGTGVNDEELTNRIGKLVGGLEKDLKRFKTEIINKVSDSGWGSTSSGGGSVNIRDNDDVLYTSYADTPDNAVYIFDATIQKFKPIDFQLLLQQFGVSSSVEIKYTKLVDKVGDSTTYIGEAIPGSSLANNVWRIQRIAEDGDDITITWAEGSADFDKVWNDRLLFSYS